MGKGNISPLESVKDQVIDAFHKANGNKTETVRILRENGVETSLSSIRRALERWQIQDPEIFDLPSYLSQPKHPIVLDKKEVYDEDIEEWWESIQRQQELYSRVSRLQDRTYVNFEFDEPIGIAYLSDLHLGAFGTRYDYVTDVLDAISEAEGCYLILAGDMFDNMIWKRAGGNRELVRSSIQKLMVKELNKRMFMKTLAFTLGCHENFSIEYDDFDFGEYLASHTMGSYLGEGGDVYISVKGAPYHIHVRHKFKGESTLNIENVFRRLFDGPVAGTGFDIGVIGHMHYEPFIMHLTRGEGSHRKDVIYIRPGTAKVYDRWLRQRHGRFGAEFVVPMTILYPERQNIVPFKHLGTGLEFLRLLREDWNEGNETEIMD